MFNKIRDQYFPDRYIYAGIEIDISPKTTLHREALFDHAPLKGAVKWSASK